MPAHLSTGSLNTGPQLLKISIPRRALIQLDLPAPMLPSMQIFMLITVVWCVFRLSELYYTLEAVRIGFYLSSCILLHQKYRAANLSRCCRRSIKKAIKADIITHWAKCLYNCSIYINTYFSKSLACCRWENLNCGWAGCRWQSTYGCVECRDFY